ncbi:hypothetical protein GQ54DRAFT_56408 [Martensiomyces pterosporus]|nr:hypothetical protein GQ54DRAFT_56408 [Martensiomyces pterosporus]
MNAHQIRQQGRRQWLQRKRKQYGEGFMAGEDDGAGGDGSDLIVFSYGARLFPRAESVEGVSLIPLETSAEKILVDRYDVRHLLGPGSAAESTYSTSDPLSDPHLNALRFAALDLRGDERDIHCMDREERRAYIDQLANPKEPADFVSGVPLQYDDKGNPVNSPQPSPEKDTKESTAEEPPFSPAFAVPEEIAVPETHRVFEIIERTAKFVESQPAEKANQMEIVIQGKQGNNPDFEFLNQSSSLHQFYKHIRWLVQTGLYGYAGTESGTESEPEAEPEPKADLGASAEAASQPAKDGQPSDPAAKEEVKPQSVCVPDDVAIPDKGARELVDRVASIVASSANPQKLETKLRIEKATSSAAYAFLSPFDKFNRYYCFRRDCYANGAEVVLDGSDSGKCQGKAEQPHPPAADTSASDDQQDGSTKDIQAKRRRLAAEFLKRKRSEQS